MKKLITLLALAFCLNAKAQIITTVVGNGTGAYAGDGGQATAAEIGCNGFCNGLGNITFDALGNLYIADADNNRIRKVNTVGIINTIAGNGTAGYSGDGGQATAAEIYANALAFDATGNLYIAAGANIRKVNTLGIIATIAGNGTVGYNGDGGQATAAEISAYRIVMDGAGNLYISDWNNRIRKVNTAGIITTIAGNGTNGYSGDGGQATAAELWTPEGINIDAIGNLYIADWGNNKIRKINTLGIISTLAGNETSCYSGDGGQATAAELRLPSDVAIDALGNIYIADASNNLIRKVNTSGIITER